MVLLFLFSLRPSHLVLSFPRAGEVASIAVFFVYFFCRLDLTGFLRKVPSEDLVHLISYYSNLHGLMLTLSTRSRVFR